MAASSDAVIEGVAGAIGAVVALTSTYPLLTVSARHPGAVWLLLCCCCCCNP